MSRSWGIISIALILFAKIMFQRLSQQQQLFLMQSPWILNSSQQLPSSTTSLTWETLLRLSKTLCLPRQQYTKAMPSVFAVCGSMNATESGKIAWSGKKTTKSIELSLIMPLRMTFQEFHSRLMTSTLNPLSLPHLCPLAKATTLLTCKLLVWRIWIKF